MPASDASGLSAKRRNRRKTVRARREESSEDVSQVRAATPERLLLSRERKIDAIQQLDTHLVKEKHAVRAKPRAKRVQVQFTAHEPSAHIIRLQGMARRVTPSVRAPQARSMHAWVVPFEAPPSLERMAAEAVDLHVDIVNVQELYEQFTPFDPEIAYRARHGLWERVRSPFIRWELAWHQVPIETSLDSEEELEIVAPVQAVMEVSSQELEEQFTREREPSEITRRMRHWKHLLGDRLEGAVESLRTREEEFVAEAEQSWGVPMLVPKVSMVRVVIGFAALLCIVSLPAGAVSLSRSFSSSVDRTMVTSREAVERAQGAFQDGQVNAAALGAASAQFASASAELTQANGIAITAAQALPKTRELYRSAQLLLEAGQKSTRAAQLMAEGVSRAWEMSVQHPDERLLALATYLRQALPLVGQASQAVSNVDPEKLPTELRTRVTLLKTTLAQGEYAVRELQSLVNLGVAVLGHDRPRTYLFVFQNQTELRPTGGFMGSIAEVIFDRGELRSIRVPGGGPYDLRNQLLARVRPPEPLGLVSSRWEFQDANWFPDFPTSAEKINWFWSQSNQPTLDGVIAINATVLQSLLTLTGPVTLSEYGKTFDADNVLLELQKSVELEYDKAENKPKKIIGDLLPAILEKMKATDHTQMLRYAQAFGTALETKEMQVWFRDPEEQAQMTELHWDGAFPAVVGDTLAVNEANIGGQKTDAVIDEQVTHDIAIQEDGSIVDTLTLVRRHNGLSGELFHGANNVAYVRAYVPQGSILLSATGFQPPPTTAFKQPLAEDLPDADVTAYEQGLQIDPSGVRVTQEFGRTAYGGWVQLGPGKVSETTYRYKLPFTAFELAERLKVSVPGAEPVATADRAAYFLSIVSQSGKPGRGLIIRLQVPVRWQLAWTNQKWQLRNGIHELTIPAWDRDRAIALLFDLPHDSPR